MQFVEPALPLLGDFVIETVPFSSPLGEAARIVEEELIVWCSPNPAPQTSRRRARGRRSRSGARLVASRSCCAYCEVANEHAIGLDAVEEPPVPSPFAVRGEVSHASEGGPRAFAIAPRTGSCADLRFPSHEVYRFNALSHKSRSRAEIGVNASILPFGVLSCKLQGSKG